MGERSVVVAITPVYRSWHLSALANGVVYSLQTGEVEAFGGTLLAV